MERRTKIFVIDDEIQIRRLLRVSLDSQGYDVEEAASGKEGLKMFPLIQPNMVLLDLGLPDMDGQEVLKSIRKISSIPLIILSVRNDEQSIIQALDSGADDYLAKPFHTGELFARIRLVLRKSMPTDPVPVFESGELRIDFTARLVTVGEKEIKLTATEYDLLSAFVRHAGKILTHRQLLKEVWGGQSVEQNQYLRVYVGHLRQKIELDPQKPTRILTEPGIGYRFKTTD
jgi:two-component system, OmpR family, KDP operon response regulator KdpE